MTPGSMVTLLAYLVAMVMVVAEARRRRLATEGMGYLAVAGLAGGVLGARLAHWLLVEPQMLAAYPLGPFDVRQGGRTILGGVVGGWLAVEVAKRMLGIRRSTGDLFAPALAVGEAIGRIGCFLNGCCYGRPGDVPWACYQHGADRHPTQFYTLVWCLAMYAVLRRRRDRMRREGELFRLYLVMWGAGRFVIEFWRESGTMAMGLSAAQWAALAVVTVGALSLRRPVGPVAPDSPA